MSFLHLSSLRTWSGNDSASLCIVLSMFSVMPILRSFSFRSTAPSTLTTAGCSRSRLAIPPLANSSPTQHASRGASRHLQIMCTAKASALACTLQRVRQHAAVTRPLPSTSRLTPRRLPPGAWTTSRSAHTQCGKEAGETWVGKDREVAR